MRKSSSGSSRDKFGIEFIARFEQKLGTEKYIKDDPRLRQQMLDLCKEALWQPSEEKGSKRHNQLVYYFTLICAQAHEERDAELESSMAEDTVEQQSLKLYVRDFVHGQYSRCAELFAENMAQSGVRNINRILLSHQPHM